jgi:hypothetical protein
MSQNLPSAFCDYLMVGQSEAVNSTEIDVSRRQVVQALVVSSVVVVLNELADAVFELSRQIVVLQQDPIFH